MKSVKFTKLKHNCPYRYFPFKDGKFPTSSAVMSLARNLSSEDQTRFQFDGGDVMYYLRNKMRVRRQDRASYYYEANYKAPSIGPINKFVAEQLVKEQPEIFSLQVKDTYHLFHSHLTDDYIEVTPNWDWLLNSSNIMHFDVFDALCCQVPEDLVVVWLDPSTMNDEAIRIHLHAPNGWAANHEIGHSFAQIHNDVRKADGSLVVRKPSKMVNAIINMKDWAQRVGAFSFRSNAVLNRHPEKGYKDEWHWNDDQEVYLRLERQTITPFKDQSMFLFTIRTYFCDLLNMERQEQTLKAIEDYDPNIYPRAWMEKNGEDLKAFLGKQNI